MPLCCTVLTENGRMVGVTVCSTVCTLTADRVACSPLKLRVCIVICRPVVLRTEDDATLVAALRVGDCMLNSYFKCRQKCVEVLQISGSLS